MNNNEFYVVSSDPGWSGSIFCAKYNKDGKIIQSQLYKMPVIKTKVGPKKKQKTKTFINLKEVSGIFAKYKDKDVLFALQRVATRPGESPIASFSFGAGWGVLRGIAAANGFNEILVLPNTWKKHYPELLLGDESVELKQQQKQLKIKIKEEESKLEDLVKQDKKNKKLQIKQLKKQCDKISLQFKKQAKSAARMLAAKLFPEYKDEFKQVNQDGNSEACLLNKYAYENREMLLNKIDDIEE